jgi:hypothetical protein
MNIYDRKPRPWYGMLLDDERRRRPVVDDGGRGKLRGLADADAHERGARRALFARLNLDAPAPASG